MCHSDGTGMLCAPGSAAKRPRSEPRARSASTAGSAPRPAEARYESVPALPRQAASGYGIGDAVYQPLIVLMLFVGLAAIGLAIWFIYMREYVMPASGPAPGQAFGQASRSLVARSQDDMSSLLASIGATRDAQQIEIAQLQNELAAVRQELANVPTPPAVPGASLTNAGPFGLEKPPLALILDVPLYKQERNLSCEASAAAMAANFFGISVSESDILHALPRHENPHLGFRGNVDGTYGGLSDYGVYAEPIRQVLVGFGLDVKHLDGGTDEIKQHIREGRPVIVWVTYRLQAQFPQQVVLADPNSEDGARTVAMVPYEHAVLVIGYNRDGLWVNDPYAGTQDFYPDSDFGRSFAYLDNMALVVGPPGADGSR